MKTDRDLEDLMEGYQMNQESYAETQRNLLLLVPFVIDLRLTEFLEAINDCESVAPIIDPTLYQKGASKLQDVKALARAALGLQNEIHRQLEKEAAQ